jgi:hypothetical protein
MFYTFLIFSYLFTKINSNRINDIRFIYKNKNINEQPFKYSTIKCEDCVFFENDLCIKFPKIFKNDKFVYEYANVLRDKNGICGPDASFFQDKSSIYNSRDF